MKNKQVGDESFQESKCVCLCVKCTHDVGCREGGWGWERRTERDENRLLGVIICQQRIVFSFR